MAGSDTAFCATVSGNSGSVALDQLVQNCYVGGIATETLDPTKLMQLEWIMVSSAGTTYSVNDFCIEEVSCF